ncbi:hypothetical protein LBMAG43_06170 [Methylococcaceae bacterium]|jgi:uncharacterized protein (DUF58 family)|nr:hypothetical protein LBMAG43_06170 [Methylococcaceae bacterium]
MSSNVSSSPNTTFSLKILVDLARPATALKLHRSKIKAKQNGGYVSRFKGRGMEFDENRLYQAGDDVRSIDWRVTARTGKTYIKLFREERERPVFISVDQRSAMQFATRGVFKSVLAAKLAALLAWTAHHHGDRIGGQLFFDTHCQELKPQNGKQAVLHFLNALVNPKENLNQAPHDNLEPILNRLLHHARPSSLLYIISDFRGLTPHAETQLTKLSQHCDVVLIFIYDELEKNLPKSGQYRFTQNSESIIVDMNEKQARDYEQRFLEKEQHLQHLAKQHGMICISINTLADVLACLRI